jgi:hypothetical protein
MTRLVLGVDVGRAAMFVTIGLIFGVAFGGGLAAVLSAVRLPSHDAQVAEAAVAAHLAAAPVTPAATAGAIPPTAHPGGSTGTSVTIPAMSASALSQALIVDTRLHDSTTGLESALANPKLDVQVASQLLRNAAADAVVGVRLTQSLATWSGGTAVAGRLTTFYSTVQTTASEGLGASILNETAYREAAVSMVQLLGGLGSVDGQARSLATSAGITVPPPLSSSTFAPSGH